MKAITEEFVTDLTVADCADAFRRGAQASYGGIRKLQAFTASMADRPKAEFRFFKPEQDPVFGEVDDDPPTWTGAAAVPGLNKLAGTVEMVVHIYVWDRESHREVALYAPYTTGDKGSTQRVLSRIEQEFPPLVTHPQTGAELPSGTLASAPPAIVVVDLDSGPLTFTTGPAVSTVTRGSSSQPPRPAAGRTEAAQPNTLTIPSPSSPQPRKESRWPMYAVVAVLVAAVGLGFFWFSGSRDSGDVETAGQSSGQEASGDQQDSTGDQEESTTQTGATVPVDLAENGAAGVWTGQAYYPDAPGKQRNYEVTLRLEGQGDGSVDGQMRYRNSSTGVVGAWQVSGESYNGQISLVPGSWIGRPNSQWSRESLELTQGVDGALSGSATNEYDLSATGSVELDVVAQTPVDEDSVAQDWRVALVAGEDDALDMLDQMREQDLAVRDSLDGYWVPQVSSGCQGLRTAFGPLMASSILATHASALQKYGAITVTWDDVGTEPPEACPNDTMWVALVPETFSKAAGAKRWCTANGFVGGSCAARYLVPRGQRGTDIEYLD
jgi:hypothetical protein